MNRIRIRSHEQISSCNNGGCSTLHPYHFQRQKKTHRSLIFAAVSGSLPASSPAISGAQTLSGLRGIAAKWNINIFAYTLFDLLAFHTRRSARVSRLSSPIQPSRYRRKALFFFLTFFLIFHEIIDTMTRKIKSYTHKKQTKKNTKTKINKRSKTKQKQNKQTWKEKSGDAIHWWS